MSLGLPLPAWAAQYIGIPFSECGYGMPDGYNCWTLARAIQWEQYAVPMPKYDVYTSTKGEENKTKIDQAIHEGITYWTDVTKEWHEINYISEGALIFFRLERYGLHVGTILNEEFMIHVLENIDVSLCRYATNIWKPRTIGMFQHCSRML